MEDAQILARIQNLIMSEHVLREPGGHGTQGDVKEIEVLLDQCWDLLRQRRARREFGEDPDRATVREDRVVEGYLS
ncbi:DUF2630 family protein [Kineosporia sp. NBRC 101731]|uniref:DUF2630 family protein n=1 Tax=Kineosporia sp. NBRC 101731 TaxID=3032199 RepID=UPI0024A576F0|nr:hypothetical protein Kisp02_22610 [Kineosporia sp. NBRC 101731]